MTNPPAPMPRAPARSSRSLSDDGQQRRVIRSMAREVAAKLGSQQQHGNQGTARDLVMVYDGGHIPNEPYKTYLGHPVSVSADDVEGATPTFTPDETVTIPFVVVNHPPRVGDLLVIHHVGGRWVGEMNCLMDLTILCNGVPVASATVTLKQGSKTVFTGTTNSSGQVTVRAPGANVYTITVTADGYTPYSATIAIVCSGAATVSICHCLATVCVIGCNGNPVSGATVTISAPSGPVSGTTSAFANGCVTLGVGAAGSYMTTISAPGYQTYSGEIQYTCSGFNTITLLPSGGAPCQFIVYGCNGCLLTGAIVSINGQTISTNEIGIANVTLPAAGTYPFTVSASRFEVYSGTLTVASVCDGCPPTIVPLTPATGYVCPGCPSCSPGAYPWPTQLHLTDAQWGNTTLNYDGTNWVGTIPIDWTGGCNCSAGAWTAIDYLLSCVSGLTVTPVVDGGHAEPTQCVNVEAASIPSVVNVSGWTLTAIPVDASATIAPCDCATVPGFDTTYCADGPAVVYPDGATITITE